MRSTSRKQTNDRLRKLRLDEKGWTMSELARKADVSAQTVRKAERGEAISEVSMARIAKALGSTVKTLFPD
jgi:transcriptional regulator with XRE-family HTH domain